MWKLFDYVTPQQKNDILAWLSALQKRERARIESKFDMLEEHGLSLPAKLLTDTPDPKIKKMRVNGAIALRPLLCVGPIDMAGEFTLLKGATEKDDEFAPKDAVEVAASRRVQVSENPTDRRCDHGEEPKAKVAGASC